MIMTASDDDSSAMNRRPSELNAATDLVGLSVPPNKVEDDVVNPSYNFLHGDGGGITKEEPAGVASKSQLPIKIEPKIEPRENPPPTAPPQSGPPQSQNAPEIAAPTHPEVAPKPRSGSSDAEPAQGGAADDDDAEKTAFPILLHEIVTDPATDECIHWLACGTRFMISDKKKFAKDVLPRFYGHAKFTSFTRRLKRWSFTRVPSGPFMGAYYNPNFRKGEPDLAARVRYDHPAPLSGAAMQLNKAKLQAVGSVAAAMGGAGGGGFMNPMMGQMPLSDGDREALLRQMNMMNGGVNNLGMMQGAMPQTGAGASGNANLESLYRAMSQNAAGVAQPNNLAATNNSVALQMAMAQEMMQQRQAQMNPAMGNFGPLDQARLLAQQQQMQQQQNNQGQMSLLNAASGFNNTGAAAMAGQQQSQGGQGPEDQRILAAMFLDRLNKQNQQQQPSPANLQQQLQQQQQQQQMQQQNMGTNFQRGSMPSLTSITPSSSLMSSHPSGMSNFNFAGETQNASDGSLSNNQQQAQSNASLTTLTGGRASSAGAPANNPGTPLQLNYPNPNTAAGAVAAAGAGAPANPNAMNALLADYLRRTSNAGRAPAGGNAVVGADGSTQYDNSNGESKTEASC